MLDLTIFATPEAWISLVTLIFLEIVLGVDNLVFISWHPGGEVFRSGCCFVRGGRIFYFQPGHETFPIYYQPEIQTVITNAVRWVAPTYPIVQTKDYSTGWQPSVEPIHTYENKK